MSRIEILFAHALFVCTIYVCFKVRDLQLLQRFWKLELFESDRSFGTCNVKLEGGSCGLTWWVATEELSGKSETRGEGRVAQQMLGTGALSDLKCLLYCSVGIYAPSTETGMSSRLCQLTISASTISSVLVVHVGGAFDSGPLVVANPLLLRSLHFCSWIKTTDNNLVQVRKSQRLFAKLCLWDILFLLCAHHFLDL